MSGSGHQHCGRTRGKINKRLRKESREGAPTFVTNPIAINTDVEQVHQTRLIVLLEILDSDALDKYYNICDTISFIQDIFTIETIL